MNIQWFPGHMAKTKKILIENLKLIDVVIELLDSRIPFCSKNPEIDELIKLKPKVIVLNKTDLADSKVSNEWVKWYTSKGQTAILLDSMKGRGIPELKSYIKSLMKEKIERQFEKGIKFRPVRAMVVGIPNVGKSSFINKISGRSCAITGDKPGVTRGKQWIRINEEIDLLDTPGILWPKFEDKRVGINLAITGAIKDEVLDIVEVATNLVDYLKINYPENLKHRYKLLEIDNFSGYEILKIIGKNRGCIIKGGEIDYTRIASIILDELRGGQIGKISLETPI